MNAEALKRTRDAIAANPGNYDQREYYHECGTPACVAGFAIVANGWELVTDAREDRVAHDPATDDKRSIWPAARDILGLTDDQAATMFHADASPWGRDAGPSPAPAHAIAMLDCAIETGEVRWDALLTDD